MVELGKNHTLIWSKWGNRIFIGKRDCFFNRKTGKRFFKAFYATFYIKKGLRSLFLSHVGEKSSDEAGQLLRKSEDFTGCLFDAEVKIFKDNIALTDLTVKI